MIRVVQVGEVFTGDLPETPTYLCRAWTWVPLAAPTDNRIGTLTIELLSGKRVAWVESDTYAVFDGGELPGLMGRRYWLRNLAPADDLYEVVIGGLTGCTCPAGAYRAKEPEPCKHIAVLRALAAAGLLHGEPTAAELAAH